MRALSPLAAEFTGLMRRLRWNQSETARQLFVTPSHINQIASGKAEPSPAMLQLLKLTAARLQPALVAGLPSPDQGPDELDEFWAALRRRKLDRLPPAARREFIEAWGKILGLPPRRPEKSKAQ
jgi:transcriptional regulator with XRE-family HTH domain